MEYDSKEDSLREMEKLMDLKEGELDNQFTQLSSLSCCTVISQILKEVTGGLAVAPAALQRSYRGEKIRDYVTHVITVLMDLRLLYLEDHKKNENRRKHKH